MTALVRSLLVLGVTGLLVVGCGQKEEAAPAEAAPAPAVAEPGGYEPTAEERVPGITIDPAALAAESAAVDAADGCAPFAAAKWFFAALAVEYF